MSIKNKVKILYNKYYEELIHLQPVQKRRHPHLNAHYDDIESEILYMFIRDYVPNHIIEFSPQFGWSTSWIIEALNKNQHGRCVSYDLHNRSVQELSKRLNISRWNFIKGDVEDSYKSFDFALIDFIFIDSGHSIEFTKNYIDNVILPADEAFKKNGQSVPIFIHDVYGKHKSSKDEGKLIKNFISKKNIDYFTPSILCEDRKEIDQLRDSLNLSKNIIHTSSNVNPVVIFKIGIQDDS
jgi:hypothetical protein